MHVALETGVHLRQRLDSIERYRANLAVLERNGLAAVRIGCNRLDPHDLTGKVIANDLLATIFGQHYGLARAAANSIERVEPIANAKQHVTFAQAAAHGYEPIDCSDDIQTWARRHAEIAQRTCRTPRPADVAQCRTRRSRGSQRLQAACCGNSRLPECRHRAALVGNFARSRSICPIAAPMQPNSALLSRKKRAPASRHARRC